MPRMTPINAIVARRETAMRSVITLPSIVSQEYRKRAGAESVGRKEREDDAEINRMQMCQRFLLHD